MGKVDYHDGMRWVIEFGEGGMLGYHHYVYDMSSGETVKDTLAVYTSEDEAEKAMAKHYAKYGDKMKPHPVEVTRGEFLWILGCGLRLEEGYQVHHYCYNDDLEQMHASADFLERGKQEGWRLK